MARRHPNDSDCIGHWQMDQATGDEPDVSGNGRTMTEDGTVASVASSPFGDGSRSRYLGSGNSDFFRNSVDAAAFEGHSELTVSAWVQPTEIYGSAAKVGTIFSLWNGGVSISLSMNDGVPGVSNVFAGSVSLTGNNLSVLSTTPVTDLTKFYLVTMVWTGTVGYLYINAALDMTDATATGSMQSGKSDIGIGKSYAASIRFVGNVADVAVYNTAKDLAWLMGMYRSGGFALTAIGLEFGSTGRQKKLGPGRRM